MLLKSLNIIPLAPKEMYKSLKFIPAKSWQTKNVKFVSIRIAPIFLDLQAVAGYIKLVVDGGK